MTDTKDQSATYARVPWVALGIIVVLVGLWWNSHTNRQAAEVAQARQDATVSAQLLALTQLVNAQNNQITTLNGNILAARQEAADARQSAEMANDAVAEMRIEMAKRGMPIRSPNP